jgi:uncharacterized membrane protein YcgQ (UPF0703/DUF1980 family)
LRRKVMKKVRTVFGIGIVQTPALGLRFFLLSAFLVGALSVSGCQNKPALSYGSSSKNANTAGTLSVLLPENFRTETEAQPPLEQPSAFPAPEQELPGIEMPSTVIEIKEKLFIAQTNDIYLNPEDYLGKGIKIAGLFKREGYTGTEYCFVIRYGPGCCGTDGNAGFEVAWEGSGEYPQVDEWVEATGVLKTYDEDGYPYLYIALSSLDVLEERGAEYVTH